MVCGTVYIVQAVPRNANLICVRLTTMRELENKARCKKERKNEARGD
jgi:hypothetical protein